MRIIAGKFRGRRLRGPRGTALRPTSDRLKETLFGILGSSISDTAFVDVFAGTGSVGLEAVSRGAREVLFIESNAQALHLIQENLSQCGIAGGCRVLPQDVFTALRQLGREGYCADTVFLDPPYDWKPYRDLLEICFRTGLVRDGSWIVVEHHAKADLPATGEDYGRVRIVRQGEKCLSFYAYKRA